MVETTEFDIEEYNRASRYSLWEIVRVGISTNTTVILAYYAHHWLALLWCVVAIWVTGRFVSKLRPRMWSSIYFVFAGATLPICCFASLYVGKGIVVRVTDRYPPVLSASLLLEPGDSVELSEHKVQAIAEKYGWTKKEANRCEKALSADALYFSTVTWTTLGYGDIHPSADARAYAAIEAFFGYLFMGLMVAVFWRWLEASFTQSNKIIYDSTATL